MIPANAVASQLQAYVKPADLPLVQMVDAVEEVQRLFTIGEQVRAQVTSQLPSGRFAVLVKDQLLDLNLPRNTQPGQEFDMEVLTNAPRLAFLLPRQALVGMPPAPVAPQPSNTSTPVVLSEAGRFIGDLLAEASPDGQTPQAATASTAQPLADDHGPLNTVKLADALKQALGQSGLFYESHLAEWADGKRSLQQVLQELPASWRMGPANATNDAAAANLIPQEAQAKPDSQAKSGHAMPGSTAQLAVNSALNEQTKLNEQDKTEALVTAGKHAAGFLEDMPATARQLVQQQLQVMDNRQLMWMGQAWPDQTVKWEVEADRDPRAAEELGGQTIWRTRLSLDLPRLGEVEAQITLVDRHRVEVVFRVAEQATAARIRAEHARLQTQLDTAGLELVANQVALDESGA